jgi:hypothetical protein
MVARIEPVAATRGRVRVRRRGDALAGSPAAATRAQVTGSTFWPSRAVAIVVAGDRLRAGSLALSLAATQAARWCTVIRRTGSAPARGIGGGRAAGPTSGRAAGRVTEADRRRRGGEPGRSVGRRSAVTCLLEHAHQDSNK